MKKRKASAPDHYQKGYRLADHCVAERRCLGPVRQSVHEPRPRQPGVCGVRHQREQPETLVVNHRCHNKACGAPCRPKHLLCKACWFRVPQALRAAVWAAYQPGQEERKVRPTLPWFRAAKAAIAAAREATAGNSQRAA